ncbi:hypothetical protein [Chlamydiifrater phoenicopteri]|uniref:hypothetical protein n=1 Tax=Chlamydiifrater phoenicopteri TaxID=2681469 RepID=UPI001BD0D6B8|nr:hypothetical protein [Chlamydiifrater phoenicopteri]
MSFVDDLKIYVYRLKNIGDRETLQYTVAPETFAEKGLEQVFSCPVQVSGHVERVDDEQLILSLSLQTEVGVSCPFCDKAFLRPVAIESICHLIEREQLRDGVFDCSDLIRQEILLESEGLYECEPEGCPSKAGVESYLQRKEEKFGGNNPFENL